MTSSTLNIDTMISGNINAKTKILAVIGDPIHHSMSPTMHNAAITQLGIDYVYIAFHVKNQDLEKACNGFRALNIVGINVTIPHKVAIMKYLDEIDPIAQGIGAINTIKNENGILKAKNTDGEGALMSLFDAGFDPANKKCVILGCGGASRAISFMLGTKAREIILTDINSQATETLHSNLVEFYNQAHMRDILSINSSPVFRKIGFDNASLSKELEDADLLVNATPVGMLPNIKKSPLDGMGISLKEKTFVFDCVYNPLNTKLIQDAQKSGCKTLEGINMLVNQGAAAFQWWTGIKPDSKIMKTAALKKLNIN